MKLVSAQIISSETVYTALAEHEKLAGSEHYTRDLFAGGTAVVAPSLKIVVAPLEERPSPREGAK